MTALTSLEVGWFVINVVYWGSLAALVAGVLWFIGACAAARAEDRRHERVWEHPSNVTVLPRLRPFDHERDV